MRPEHETPWTKYIALVGILVAAANFCGLRMVKHGTTRCKRFPPGGFDSMGVRGFGIRRQPDCAGLRRCELSPLFSRDSRCRYLHRDGRAAGEGKSRTVSQGGEDLAWDRPECARGVGAGPQARFSVAVRFGKAAVPR